MAGSVTLILPAVILAGGAFLVYLLSRALRLSNRTEALLTVLVLAGSLASLLVLFIQLPGLVGESGEGFGLETAGGIIYQPNAVGVFVLILSTVIAILVTIYSAE